MLPTHPWLSFALSIASLVLGATQETLTLQDRCEPNLACVEMTIDVPSTAFLRITRPQDSLEYTTFEVRLRGVIGGGAEADHVLGVRGYTDGIECSRFGQATAAVVGHSRDGHPILLTSRGPLEVRDTALRVGCLDCATIRDSTSQRLVASRRTPGWDLALAETRADSLFVSEEAELVLHKGGRLLELTAAGAFRFLQHHPPSNRYRLELRHGACT